MHEFIVIAIIRLPLASACELQEVTVGIIGVTEVHLLLKSASNKCEGICLKFSAMPCTTNMWISFRAMATTTSLDLVDCI